MKKFKLKVPRYTFDHKGMIIRGKLNEQYTMYAITKLITLFDQLFSIETIMLFIFIALGVIETSLHGF